MRPAIYNRLFKLDGGYELAMPNSYSSGIRFRFGGIVHLMIIGVVNGTSKNVGLRKFCQDLEISEAFMISLEVSFFHGLFLLF